MFKSQTNPTPAHVHNLGDSNFIPGNNLFYPEFGLGLKHSGFINPTHKCFLVSVKYDFNDLKSHDWIHEHIYNEHGNNVPSIVLPDSEIKQFRRNSITTQAW